MPTLAYTPGAANRHIEEDLGIAAATKPEPRKLRGAPSALGQTQPLKWRVQTIVIIVRILSTLFSCPEEYSASSTLLKKDLRISTHMQTCSTLRRDGRSESVGSEAAAAWTMKQRARSEHRRAKAGNDCGKQAKKWNAPRIHTVIIRGRLSHTLTVLSIVARPRAAREWEGG